MTTYYKTRRIEVMISPDKRKVENLGAEFYSYDTNVAKLVLALKTEEGYPLDLTGATVRFLLTYTIDDKKVKLEEPGEVEAEKNEISYVLSEKLRGYSGTVTAGVYVDLATGEKIDIQNVTFKMKKSLVDEEVEELSGSFFHSFDSELIKFKEEIIPEKVEELNALLPAANQEIEALIAQKKQEIQKLVDDYTTEAELWGINLPFLSIDLQTLQERVGQIATKFDEELNKLRDSYSKKNNAIQQTLMEMKVEPGWPDNSGGIYTTIYGEQKRVDYGNYLNSLFREKILSINHNRSESFIDESYLNARINHIIAGFVQGKMENLVENADFSSDLSSWTLDEENKEGACFVEEGVLMLKEGARLYQMVPCQKGHVYAVFVEYTSDKGNEYITFGSSSLKHRWPAAIGRVVLSERTIDPSGKVKLSFYNPWSEIAKIKRVCVYDMTTIFGEGNELNAEDFYDISKIVFTQPPVYTHVMEQYPVGTVLCLTKEESPSFLMKGTWELIGSEEKFDQQLYYYRKTHED